MFKTIHSNPDITNPVELFIEGIRLLTNGSHIEFDIPLVENVQDRKFKLEVYAEFDITDADKDHLIELFNASSSVEQWLTRVETSWPRSKSYRRSRYATIYLRRTDDDFFCADSDKTRADQVAEGIGIFGGVLTVFGLGYKVAAAFIPGKKGN